MLRVYSSILFIIQSYLKPNGLFLSPKEKLTYKYTKPKYFTHTNFHSPPSNSRKPEHLSSFSLSRFSSSFFFFLFQETFFFTKKHHNFTTPPPLPACCCPCCFGAAGAFSFVLFLVLV